MTIRVLLPILFGMRMCPMCPQCNANDNPTPCQDKVGSNAEPCGGIHGRADALVGAIEYQGSTGSPHFHADVFLQQAHQHKTMEEIGKMLQEGLLHVDTIKEYQSYINDECYVDQKNSTKNDQLSKQAALCMAETVGLPRCRITCYTMTRQIFTTMETRQFWHQRHNNMKSKSYLFSKRKHFKF